MTVRLVNCDACDLPTPTDVLASADTRSGEGTFCPTCSHAPEHWLETMYPLNEWSGHASSAGYPLHDDGYDFIQMAQNHSRQWRVVSAWGERGWDMGDWPLVAWFVKNESRTQVQSFGRVIPIRMVYRAMEYCEGDLHHWTFASDAARTEFLNSVAVKRWAEQVSADVFADARAEDVPPITVDDPRVGPYVRR